MGKKSPREPHNKTQHSVNDHLFVLRNVKRRTQIEVDFTPAKALSIGSKKQQLVTYPIIPTFNKDNKYYSDAFYTPYEGLSNDYILKGYH